MTLYLQLSSAFHGLQHGYLVGIFDIAAGWYARSDSCHLNAGPLQQSCEMDGRGLALDGRVGGDDDLIQAAALNPFQQRRYAQLFRPHSVQWRNGSMKNVIDAVIKPGFFNGSDIGGLFHHADQSLIAGGAGAVTAWINIRDIAAYRTKMKFFFKIADGRRQGVSIL